MLYCLVEQGQLIQGPGRLPKSWRNVSGLNLLNEAGLIALGWLPYIDVKPEHNKDTQYITGTRVISADAVTMNNVVNDYTAEQMATRIASAKESRKTVIRQSCETRIFSVYPQTMQTNVSNGLYGSDVGDPMKVAIAGQLVESNACEDAVDAADTLAAIRAVEPDWPIEDPNTEA